MQSRSIRSKYELSPAYPQSQISPKALQHRRKPSYLITSFRRRYLLLLPFIVITAMIIIASKRNPTSNLQNFDPPPSSTLPFPPPPTLYNLCILIRTSPSHFYSLPTLLTSLLTSPLPPSLTLSLTLHNFDTSPLSPPFYSHILSHLSHLPPSPSLRTRFSPISHPYDNLYGYTHTSLPKSSSCTHHLITNGDNYYLPEFVSSLSFKKGLLFQTVDFLSHHPRDYNVIKNEVKRGFIDLGSFVFSDEIEVKGFMDLDIPESDRLGNFARDWYFVKELTKNLKHNQIHHIRKVLYVHQ
ncbi:hypothetical protein TrVE_jg6767 [Triparma verrucosa]|uniref:Uncharacterized protein n=1 Tax=Triparma verrucosa TaxID=1606542 RepID=A0A9W7KW36_9STRA|nr:hypothetical protein TrVE_jg6767 [Triparma verrucosa]